MGYNGGMKKKQWVITGFIIILAFALVSFLLFRFLNENERAASIYTAAGTLALAAATIILAFFTWQSVHSADERDSKHREEELAREDRDRKEKLINEMINWAMEVPFFGLTEYSNLSPLSNNFQAFNKEYNRINLYGFRAIYMRGDHIERTSCIFKQSSLEEAIKKLRIEMNSYIKELETLTSGVKLDINQDLRRNNLNEYATKVIEEAAKVKIEVLEQVHSLK